MYVVRIAAALVSAILGVGALTTGAHAAEVRPMAPCKYEDGSGQARCVWDARHMGNGRGDSLVIRGGGTWDTRVRVVSHKRAHAMIAAWEAKRSA